MARKLFCVVACVATLCVVRTENIEFSIKPNGKVSHEKASMVRRIIISRDLSIYIPLYLHL